MRRNKWLVLMMVFVLLASTVLTACGGNTTEEPASTTSTENEQDQASEDSNDSNNDSNGESELASEQSIRVNWNTEPPDLDPQTSTDTVSFVILNATLEGLVRLNPDGSVGEGLAKSWDISEDGLNYTFHLRDANWDDGTAITAEDFEFAWKRALDPETASSYAYQFYGIKNGQAYNTGDITDPSEVGVKAIDDKTLEVQLERPIAYFLSLTSFITYLPTNKDLYEELGDSYGTEADQMAFSGPFKITEWNHEQKIVLEKNEDYWDADSVKLEKIEADMINDTNTPVNLYETDELDMIAVPAEYLDKYRDTPEFFSMAEATVFYMEFNAEDKFFSNKNIRKAFSMAINRDAYVNGVLANGSLPAYGFVPSGIPGKAGGNFREQNGDLIKDMSTDDDAVKKEANELLDKGLAEIGATREELAEHTSYLTSDSDLAKKLAQALQQMWKKSLGIEVDIESVSFKLRLQKMDNKDFSMVGAGWGADYNDPMTFMDMWVTGGGNNDAFWSNAQYDALIEKATTTTGDERMQALLDAEKLLLDEMPIAPTYVRARNVVEKSYVKGVARYPVGCDTEYKWAYVLKH